MTLHALNLNAIENVLVRMIHHFYNNTDPNIKDEHGVISNVCGGLLHVVLDDGNLEDNHIIQCLQKSVSPGDVRATHICHFLLALPLWAREDIYDRYEEYQYGSRIPS